MNKDLIKLIQRLLRLIDNQHPENDRLSYGRTSLILLYCYYGYYFQDRFYLDKGVNLIQEVFQNLQDDQDTFNGSEFYSGLLGFLSVLMNLNKYEIIDLDTDGFYELERAILIWTEKKLKDKDIDFFSGASSTLLYFINYLTPQNKERNIGYINMLLDGIKKVFIKTTDNLVYILNENYNSNNNIPSDTVSYGIAHGMTSIILCLLELKKKHLIDESISNLLNDILHTIIYFNKIYNTKYPRNYINEINIKTFQVRYQSHIGWCHSDLNLIHVLSMAGLNQYCEKSATILSEKINIRNREIDPFLCHGHAGISQYSLKLNSITKDDEYKNIHNKSISSILNFYNDKSDDYFFSDEFKKTGGHNHSFFYGNVGVALSLITAIEPKSKTWSEIIFI